jgi:hypothetical protein
VLLLLLFLLKQVQEKFCSIHIKECISNVAMLQNPHNI